ncbi:MAG: DUF4148 domain-containing protein [Polaromonas sp.]|nr:DUF4148 domain-containing protein [Polaromonas sp.]
MTFRIISSAVIAAAAFASMGAQAGDRIAGLDSPIKNTSIKTRAEVKNELLQAQANGFDSTGDYRNYPQTAVNSVKSRADVRAELAVARTQPANDLYSRN